MATTTSSPSCTARRVSGLMSTDIQGGSCSCGLRQRPGQIWGWLDLVGHEPSEAYLHAVPEEGPIHGGAQGKKGHSNLLRAVRLQPSGLTKKRSLGLTHPLLSHAPTAHTTLVTSGMPSRLAPLDPGLGLRLHPADSTLTIAVTSQKYGQRPYPPGIRKRTPTMAICLG
jgi:hypothetical protein